MSSLSGRGDFVDSLTTSRRGDWLEGDSSDDALMALSLITVWATRTGRSLRAVPVHELTAQELEDFWADDQLWPGPGARGPHG